MNGALEHGQFLSDNVSQMCLDKPIVLTESSKLTGWSKNISKMGTNCTKDPFLAALMN